ncbi:Uncharacterised protein [uncultured archaeon]|nr:Uncharacterised protein [uncultured archaeon]
MKIIASLVLVFLFVMLAGPAMATGMAGSGSYAARNTLEAYCASCGGTPSGGYCYFPDGTYCDLLSFYRGTCPGRAYYEQSAWMNEAYNFLYGDTIYSPSYMPYSYQNGYNYYYLPSYAYGYGP